MRSSQRIRPKGGFFAFFYCSSEIENNRLGSSRQARRVICGAYILLDKLEE
jgi:hypothetical protein